MFVLRSGAVHKIVWFCPVIEFACSRWIQEKFIARRMNSTLLKNRYRTHRFVNKKCTNQSRQNLPQPNHETVPTKPQSPPRLYQEQRKSKLQLHAEQMLTNNCNSNTTPQNGCNGRKETIVR